MTTTVKSEPESNSRKRTAEDREIEEWARKLVSKPIPQINSGQALVPHIDVAPNLGYDIDSAVGRFDWHSLGPDKHFPCLYRSGKRYCCLKLIETSVLQTLLSIIPKELYESAKLCSHHATSAEAKLLNYINSWHCDNYYGNDLFTEKDLVVLVTEVEEFYSFLNFAFKVLSNCGDNKEQDYSRCGFVHVNNENLIPYTNLRQDVGEKGLPLFYFEGQVDILECKAKPLSGWDLAYLKVCCKVQGVRKDLIAGDTLKIVKLSDLKSYFPRRTTFKEDCWPRSRGKPLLPKHVIANMTAQNQIPAVPPNNRNNSSITNERIATTLSTTNPTTVVRGPANILGVGVPVSSLNHVRRDISVNINGAQPNRVNPVAHKSLAALPKVKANGPPLPSDLARLSLVDDIPDGELPGAFNVKPVSITQLPDMTVVVINFRPFKTDMYMLLLPPFLKSLCNSIQNCNIPVYPQAVEVLRQLNIAVYLPSSQQIRAMNNFGFMITRAWEMPISNYVDVVSKMSDLQVIFQQLLSQNQNRQARQAVPQIIAANANGNYTYVTGVRRR